MHSASVRHCNMVARARVNYTIIQTESARACVCVREARMFGARARVRCVDFWQFLNKHTNKLSLSLLFVFLNMSTRDALSTDNTSGDRTLGLYQSRREHLISINILHNCA